jgi:hypothetical protein
MTYKTLASIMVGAIAAMSISAASAQGTSPTTSAPNTPVGSSTSQTTVPASPSTQNPAPSTGANAGPTTAVQAPAPGAAPSPGEAAGSNLNPYAPALVKVYGGNYIVPVRAPDAPALPDATTYPQGVFSPYTGDTGYRCGLKVFGKNLYPKCNGAGVN